MKFNDDSSEVELRLELGDESISPGHIFVEARDSSLLIRVERSGYTNTLLDTNTLYGMIKPSETIWYLNSTTNYELSLLLLNCKMSSFFNQVYR